MRWLDAARARLALLFAHRASDARIGEEIALHIEMEVARLVREEGLDSAEAWRRARVAFGGVEKHKEALRDGRGLRWLSGLSLDVKLGIRMLIKYPGLTIAAVLGMAVAVAIGAVGFSAIYGIIDATLPLDEGDRIVAIKNSDVRTGDDNLTNLHDLVTWRGALKAIDEFAAYRTIDRNLITDDGQAEPARIAEMSASAFAIARVAPVMGRSLEAGDEQSGAEPVVVIGYDVWQNRFGGARDVLGRRVALGSTTHTIVGVMPQGFAFPINNRIWTPLQLQAATFEQGQAPRVEVFGRLATGATLRDAQQQITTIAQRLAAAYPQTHRYLRPRVVPYTMSFVGSPDLAWAFHLAQFIISTLLVVIATNVAVLVYARTATRAGEIAVRTALGASRGRVIAQLLIEALLLSVLASLAGLGIASIALQQVDAMLIRFGGEQLPFWIHFGITPGVVVYVAGLAVVGALVVGVVPAMKATRSHVHANLQEVGSGAAIRLGRSWTALIVAQVAVAVIGLPLAIQAISEMRFTIAPRFASTHFLVARLAMDDQRAHGEQRSVIGKVSQLGTTPASNTANNEQSQRFKLLRSELLRKVSNEAGVSRAVFSTAIPGQEPSSRYEVPTDGTAAALAAPMNLGLPSNGVEPGFFEAYDVPILMGRGFDAGDASAVVKPVIVNQSFVRVHLHGMNPLGMRVRAVSNGRGADVRRFAWQTIIGVVPDFPMLTDSATGIQPRLYWPLGTDDGQPRVLNVRVAGTAPEAMTNRIRALALEVSPSVRLLSVESLINSIHEAGAPERLAMTALVLVVGSVLLLSIAGMYALMSLTVTRRRREIGIRAALGAGAGRLILSILARAMGQIGVGVVVGIVVTLLFLLLDQHGRVPLDQVGLLLAVIGIMSGVGLLAAVGPARRALRIQPTEALRSE